MIFSGCNIMIGPFTERDLDSLEHFLAEVARDDSMLIDELHGFLAAVICSPQMLVPSQWTPHVWGGEEPDFETLEQAQDVMGMIMRLNNDAVGRLSDGDFDPLFMEETLANGHPVLDPHGWCEGFIRGMQLQAEAWDSDELNSALMPIIVLSGTVKDDPHRPRTREPRKSLPRRSVRSRRRHSLLNPRTFFFFPGAATGGHFSSHYSIYLTVPDYSPWVTQCGKSLAGRPAIILEMGEGIIRKTTPGLATTTVPPHGSTPHRATAPAPPVGLSTYTGALATNRPAAASRCHGTSDNKTGG